MNIYRWHITRMLVNPNMDTETVGRVDVTVTPTKEDFPVYKTKEPIRSKYDLPDDDLEYWDEDNDLTLEGWTTEQALLQVLLSQNLFEDASKDGESAPDRRIVEDMVLLQIVEDSEIFLKNLNNTKSDQDLPDFTKLVMIEGARWVDYTQQARRLSKDIYNRVLVVMRERGYAEQ